MHLFLYEGPVLEFGRVIKQKWIGETWASSEKKALSNLAYRFKKDHGKLPSSKIILPGKLTTRTTILPERMTTHG